MENFEDLRLVFGRDADAVVRDGVDGLAVVDSAVDDEAQGARGFAILDGVVEQVGENLARLGVVGEAGGQGLDADFRSGFVELEFHGREDFGEEAVDVEGPDCEGDAAEARVAQEAGEEGFHLAHAGVDEPQGLGNRNFDGLPQPFRRHRSAGLGGDRRADRVAGAGELFAEALDVHERRAQVVRDGVDDGLQLLVFLVEFGGDAVEFVLIGLALRDVGADGDVLPRFSGVVEKRTDGRFDPVKRPVFRPVPNLAPPHLAATDRRPKVAEKFLGVGARVDDAVVLAEEFLAGKLGDGAELVVDVGDAAGGVGDGDDRMFVEGGFDIVQFLDRCEQASLQLLPGGIVGARLVDGGAVGHGGKVVEGGRFRKVGKAVRWGRGPGLSKSLSEMPPWLQWRRAASAATLWPMNTATLAPSPVTQAPRADDVVSRLRSSEIFRSYQQAFQTATGLPLVLRTAGSFREPLHGAKNLSPFCVMMAAKSRSCAACLELQQRAEADAGGGSVTLECFAGLSESLVPIHLGASIIAYLQTGQVLLQVPTEKQFRAAVAQLKKWNVTVDVAALREAFFQTRVLTKTHYDATVRLLASFAEHLSLVTNELMLKEASSEPPAVSRARVFIAEHLGEPLALQQVAQAAHMSAFYFCKIFKGATGLTFTDYIARARIEKTKQLLLNPHMRVSEAAYEAGFQSLSQFNRVFRRIVGESPSIYRDHLHGANAGTAGRNALACAA